MSPVNNWHHEGPKSYYPKCVEMFGEPTAKSNKKHGFALWKTRGLFNEHILRDEDVMHCVPRPHHDYFYSSIQFFIPKDKVMDVMKITGSINYDGLKKMITARCGGIGANYATLYLGMMVAAGKLTIGEVKKGDLYPKLIRGEEMSYDEMKKKMYKMKLANRKKYAKELKQDFAPYAFTQCYKPKQSGGVTRRKRPSKKSVVGKGLKNTRDEDCSIRKSTGCCPHMNPDEKHRYRATNEKSVLKLRSKRYELYTCCLMCSQAMNAQAKNDPKKFEAMYVSRYLDNGNMVAKNPHTNKEVQTLPLL